MFAGLGSNISNLWRLSDARTRSISAENFTGEKGRGGMASEGTGAVHARELGRPWKISPCINIAAGETRVLADIEGEGAINHIWMTPGGHWRYNILRIYWDGCEHPSVECPVGDFFAAAHEDHTGQVNSLAVCVNPNRGLNCYWEMPFHKRCRVTMENISQKEMVLFYQIDYTLTQLPEGCAYFHAQFRRSNPLPYKQDYTILDGVTGKGQYVGTYMLWGSNSSGWWGEGEIKFFMDGDGEYPTICGTGTEDYFCGAYCFERGGQYIEFSTPYAGMPKVIRADGGFASQQRFSLYRWHLCDPIRFESNLRVTMQAIGWRSEGRYLPLQDDISSVAFWYQAPPCAPFPALPGADGLEII